VGLKFRYKHTRCTGFFREKPLLEVRWTTEEGAYSLGDLIAGDLGLALPPDKRAASPSLKPGTPDSSPARRYSVDTPCTVIFAGPAPTNALAIRRNSLRARVVRQEEPEQDPSVEQAPGLVNKII